MYLSRTKFAYEEVVSHLKQAGSNPLIESCLVQFLLVSFYAEMEEKIKIIIQNRLDEINDRKVAAFIFRSSEGMIKRVKKAEINELLQKFDCGDGYIIGNFLGEINLQPYFDAIVNRHKVSHDQGSSMTLDHFGRALPCAEAILSAVQEALRPE